VGRREAAEAPAGRRDAGAPAGRRDAAPAQAGRREAAKGPAGRRDAAGALRAQPSAFALLGLIALALAAAAALVLFVDSEPARVSAPARVEPLRIASGNGIATGFPVANGRVVTVAHVLDGPVTVRGRPVQVLRVDRRSDLALLSVPGVGVIAPEFSSAANGEHLRVIRVRAGHSSSLSVHVRRAIVAHVRAPGAARAVRRPALDLFTPGRRGQIAPGDSGAAVVTDSGEVAGVLFAVSRDRRGTAYAVDASQVRRLFRSSVE
jgi:S1-C subfamily serine protease